MARRKKKNPLIKPFKPSKKFQRQYPKWEQTAKKRQEGIKKSPRKLAYWESYFEYAKQKFLRQTRQRISRQDDLSKIYRDIKSGRLKVDLTSLGKRLLEGNLLDQISVFSNMSGGFDEAADILDVDSELVLGAITNSRMHRLQIDELQEQLSRFRRDTDEQDLFGINIDYLDVSAAILHESERLINLHGDSPELADLLREAVGYGEIDLDKLADCYGIFNDLTTSQLGKILESWADSNFLGDIDLNAMFDLYLLDGRDIISGHLEDSAFWAWFRELFYA